MGWASGVSLFDEVMDIVLPRIAGFERATVVDKVAVKFSERDADTWDESKYFEQYKDVLE